jgi:hypothetical protein
MTRAKYETLENLTEEKNILGYISQKWDVSCSKMPISYKLDYVMYRNEELVGFAEVKSRTHAFRTFDTYIISLSKVMSARRLASVTSTKSLLIVNWSNLIGWIDFFSDFSVRQGGRSDRNDWQDQEPMCHFDINDFTERIRIDTNGNVGVGTGNSREENK